MLEEFKGPLSVVAEDGAITDGRRSVDGRMLRDVTVDVAEGRALVTLSVSDAVTVEAALDPFLALVVGEALFNAALSVYFRPGGPVRRHVRRRP